MKILLCLLINILFLAHKSAAGDLANANATDARKNIFHEIKDSKGEIVARLNLTLGNFYAELVKTKKTDSGLIGYVMDGISHEKRYGRYNFTTEPEISATKTVKPGKNKDGADFNSTKLEIVFSLKGNGSDSNDNTTAKFDVETAKLNMTVEWGDPDRLARKDYWNITAIQLTMKAKVNGTAMSWDQDLTPRFSYNKPSLYSISPACSTGFGICAPLGLCWSCGDQVLSPNDLTKVGDNKTAIIWHLPGMLFEPEWGNTVNVTGDKFRYSANWDCDPLIPLSVWVGLLVTLLLVSILAWGLQMLADLQTPNKWDDPKKPGIHVPQAE